MALKAGRVGVRKDQVDVHGKIKNSGEQYVLPTASADTLGGVKVGSGLSIADGVLSNNNPTVYVLPKASASDLGGVKAVAKTEAMTKEVGIDSDGQLYVEPSQGGGVESIGHGTIETGYTGACDYYIEDGVCHIYGWFSGVNLNVYSQTAGIVISSLPESLLKYDSTVSTIIKPTIPAICTRESSDAVPIIEFMFDSTGTGVLIRTRSNSISSGNVYHFIGCYPVANSDFVLSNLQLSNVDTSHENFAVMCKNDHMCFISAHVRTDKSSNTLATGLPNCGAIAMNGFACDSLSGYGNKDNGLTVVGTNLIYNGYSGTYYTGEGGLLYIIEEVI